MIRTAILIGMILQIFFLFYTYSSINNELTNTKYLGTEVTPKLSTFFKYYFYDHSNMSTVFVEPELKEIFRGKEDVRPSAYRYILDVYTRQTFAKLEKKLSLNFILSFLFYGLSILYIVYFLNSAKNVKNEKYMRGAALTEIKEFNLRLTEGTKEEKADHLKIGETIIPFANETKGTLILGTTGSGKSVLINQLADQINKRKKQRPADKIVYYDMKPEFVPKQMKENDILFYPFDQRTIGWSFFNEFREYPDFEIIPKALFVPDKKDHAYWYNCAADVFRAGLLFLHYNKKTTNSDIWNFFSRDFETIKHCLETLPQQEQGAIEHIRDPKSELAQDVKSIIQQRLGFFKYLLEMDGDFSFRDYLKANDSKDLFIVNIEQYSNIFKPLMTAIIEIMVREMLSLPDDLNRRVFFIIDELGSLYKIDSLPTLLTAGRSKGAGLICASQDLGRIRDTYGKDVTSTFFNNFNTMFIFRINDPENSEYVAKAIGDHQVLRTGESRQLSPSDIGDRKGFSEQDKIEKVVLPSEFQQLFDLEAYLKISGYGVTKIQIPRIFFEQKITPFEIKEFKFAEYTPVPPAKENVLENKLKEKQKAGEEKYA